MGTPVVEASAATGNELKLPLRMSYSNGATAGEMTCDRDAAAGPMNEARGKLSTKRFAKLPCAVLTTIGSLTNGDGL